MRSLHAVVGCLALVACKSDKRDDAKPAAGAAPAASGSSASSAAPVAPEVPQMNSAAADGCKALAHDDAEAVFGGQLDTQEASAMPLGFECGWKRKTPYGKVSLTLYTKAGTVFDQNLKTGLLGKDPVDMPGIGERAMMAPDGMAVMVQANGKLAYALIVGPVSDPKPRVDAFAKALVAKM